VAPGWLSSKSTTNRWTKPEELVDAPSPSGDFLTHTPIIFTRPDATAIGSISQNSATTVAYNTTSDRRIKENIADRASGLDLLAKIKVRDYNYIADPDKQNPPRVCRPKAL